MTISLHACITTRDGCIRNDVMACFMSALEHAFKRGIAVSAGRQQFNHGTATCRNKAVADFLAHTTASHLVFVDDDVFLPVDTFQYLAESLSEPGCDVACGAYPTFKFTSSSQAYLYLTARPVGGDWLSDWPDGLVEIDAGGTGCMAIRRDVFAAVGFPWFRWPEQHDPATGTVQWVSDDVDFCAAARAKGFRVWCDGRVRPGHLKWTDLKMLMTGALRWRESPPAAEDGYGSHTGALRAIAKNFPVRVAVEYGSGRHSTPLFLDKTVFANLEQLVSIESNPQWWEETRRYCGSDPRLSLQLEPIEAFADVSVPAADLVFIDCDVVNQNQHDFSQRVKLIEKYADCKRGVVVVHDANFAAIGPAVRASRFQYKATYVPPFGPHTAILSNAVDVGKVLGGKK